MNIYADRGNILFLRRRCEWRGIGFEPRRGRSRRGLRPGRPRPDLHRRRPGSRPGAGRRGHASRPSARRSQPRPATAPSCSRSAAATSCSATATSSATGGSPGSGWSTCETVREPGPRLIGNVAIESDLGAGGSQLEIAGFENHGGRTYLGAGARAARPGRRGLGNNGKDGLEGVRRANLIGTYLHGPLLPKNVGLADRLIALALARREGAEPALEPLDDGLELAAHASARRAARAG